MQTSFSTEQLKEPRLAEANAILRRCVHCGLCTATCPTYLLLGDERDSPRGRIYLIKDMLERGGKANAALVRHVDRCLSCLSCMTTCPSGVDYMHLVDFARAQIERTHRRGIADGLVRLLLAATVPSRARFGASLLLAGLARPARGLLARLGLRRLAAMLAMAPTPWRLARSMATGLVERRKRARAGALGQTAGRGRVILLQGCVQEALRPEINAATIRLLERFGYEVVVAPGAGCCGALVHHLGRERQAKAQARRNIEAWWEIIAAGPLDAILVNASGCGTMLKDYGHLLAGSEPEPARRAAHVAGLAKDVSEFLATLDLGPPKRWSSLRIAYHSACSMQHGQRITEAPRALLEKAGFAVVEIPEGHICCGSAGTYNLLQPELARRLGERKVANIEAVEPDVVATGNIGCMTQLGAYTDIPIVHTVELLDWAYGGPCPNNLRHLAKRVSEVPGSREPEPALL